MTSAPEPAGATPLDDDERAGLRFAHIQTRGELNRLEQANVVAGMNWLSRQKKPDVLSETFVLKLHRQLFGDVWRWAGQFRRTEKNVGVAPHQIAVALRGLLDNARYWIEHSTYPPMELALRFHHRLVQIHPFANGNGRHARIMTDALLKVGLQQAPIVWEGPISAADLQAGGAHRAAYVQALRQADAGNFKPLLDLFGSAAR